jgi:CRISPR-associated protein Cmr4
MGLNNLLFKITAMTNLHVGTGDRNYSIVDKLVQRDPITKMPEIHASSLKGALRVYSKDVLGWKDELNDVFGTENNPGKDVFFTANLLTLPVRSNKRPYFRATCPEILKNLQKMTRAFGLKKNKLDELLEYMLNISFTSGKQVVVFTDSIRDGALEEVPLKDNYQYMELEKPMQDTLKTQFDACIENFLIIRDDVFMELCDSLPIIARNRLDDERNLWYEEVVPRQTDFFFMYLTPDKEEDCSMTMICNNSIQENPVQIGANASIGYGYCIIKKM